MSTSTAEISTPTAAEYERDFYAWTQKQAALLRTGRLSEIDVSNIAEELESMGRSEKQTLVNRLAVLLMHLLKWQHQPNRRSNSWRYTIKEQRRAIAEHLQDNPSLRPILIEALVKAYGRALLKAIGQTGLDEHIFSTACPFTLEQILDEDYWPD